jgi:hypothetical protein
MADNIGNYWISFRLRMKEVTTTARVFSRNSPWKVAQWTGRPIRESWGVLWLVIHLLSVRADVSSSVRNILPCTQRLYCIPLHTCQHAGALPATTNTSPTPRCRTVRTKYYYCTLLGPLGRTGLSHWTTYVSITTATVTHENWAASQRLYAKFPVIPIVQIESRSLWTLCMSHMWRVFQNGSKV